MRLPRITAANEAERRLRRADFTVVFACFGAICASWFLLQASFLSGKPTFPFATGLYLLGATLIALRPLVGVYLIAFFGLLADNVSAPTWPFLKNGSSFESVMFLHDAVIASPMEGYLVLTVLATGVHVALKRVSLSRPPLFYSLTIFVALLTVGLFWGVGRGGDVNIALWEFRPFVALYGIYLLGHVLITSRIQVHLLFWTIIAAITLESLRASFWVLTDPITELYDSLVEHSGATHISFVLVSMMLAWLISEAGFARIALPLASLPALLVYFESERRSAILALLIGAIASMIYLKAENPVRFYAIGPTLAVVALVYLAVFWNASGPLAFPANAIKSEIAPDAAAAADAASDDYRKIEHFNILATIRQSPLLGVGFGQQYLRPIPLPDISFAFPWWEYITHNGLLWIWLKSGYFGFIAMFHFLGQSIVTTMRAAIAVTNPRDKHVAASAMAFGPMYIVYTYVDISWDTQSLILLALCITICTKLAAFEAASAQPESTEPHVPALIEVP